MGLEDRFFMILIGCIIGYILGRFDVKVTKIQEEVHEMDRIVKAQKNEDGFATARLLNGVALFLVVMLSFVATVKSQISDNHSNDAIDKLNSLTTCNQDILNGVVDAANDRSTYSVEQIEANVGLQSSFSDLLDLLLHRPPFNQQVQEDAVGKYHADQKSFVVTSRKQAKQAKANPWPAKDALRQCIAEATK